MTMEEAEKVKFNPFDLTKVWPQGKYPLIEVGKITLDRNPRNYFAEVEQAAFSPNNMVPGIEPSPDKMLQVRYAWLCILYIKATLTINLNYEWRFSQKLANAMFVFIHDPLILNGKDYYEDIGCLFVAKTLYKAHSRAQQFQVNIIVFLESSVLLRWHPSPPFGTKLHANPSELSLQHQDWQLPTWWPHECGP